MASIKLCDGRTSFYQWDTGVEIELCDCSEANELHFVTNSGIIKRDVVSNICSVPDAALQNAGTLCIYAFVTENGRYTRYDFHVGVMARPKPADYINPSDESATVEQIAERLKEDPDFVAETKGDQGIQGLPGRDGIDGQNGRDGVDGQDGQPGRDGSDASVTAENVNAAFSAATDAQKQAARTNIGAEPAHGNYKLIETITLEEDTASIVRTQEPNGEAYAFTGIFICLQCNSGVASAIFADFYIDGVLSSWSDALISGGINTTPRYSQVRMDKYNGAFFASSVTSTSSETTNGTVSIRQSSKIRFGNVITGMHLSCLSTSAFTAGSIITIYGVR